MLDQIIEASRNLFNHLSNAGMTDIIIYGIGFIGFCILGSLLTREDRKANPEKWARIDATTTTQNDYTMGTVVINGKMHTTTHVGNTTSIH